ncbi:unnamed protein product, partial [Sphenostylis stenocarpa]
YNKLYVTLETDFPSTKIICHYEIKYEPIIDQNKLLMVSEVAGLLVLSKEDRYVALE